MAHCAPDSKEAPLRNAHATARTREPDDLVEVPAAVVCAHCGEADCPGCLHEQTRSGVVAIVAWERPGTPFLSRLWSTAQATTFDAEHFFEVLPDGPLAPALRFAMASELLAASAMTLFLGLPLGIFAPRWCLHLLFDEGGPLARLLVAGIPGLAAMLVAAHVAHGWALDLGARRSGVPRATNRALRFGLYACGWDLVQGPLGAVVVAIQRGVGKALSIAGVGMGLPGRGARAFLRGCYRLEGEAAGPALRASYVAAAIVTAIATIAVLGALALVLLL